MPRLAVLALLALTACGADGAPQAPTGVSMHGDARVGIAQSAVTK